MKPIIFGFAGTTLTAEEKDFFARVQPFGFILFQRNIADADQVKTLLAETRSAVSRSDVPIFIDQEGGRAVRLKPPHWPTMPSMRTIGRIYEISPERGLEAMRLHARITAGMLSSLGIIGNFAPVLDLAIEGASNVIGDRSLSRDPAAVIALGRVAIDTYLANGVLPCIKHLPAHGRVKVDPHVVETVVDETEETLAEDFAPFIALRDAPLGMNSHAIFTAFDSQTPASLSPVIHQKIIREKIGFDGLLISDDMAMKAFDSSKNGPLGEIAARAIAAGTDIALHCNGKTEEMRAIAHVLPDISAAALGRWQKAKAMPRMLSECSNAASDWERLRALLSVMPA